MKELRASQDQLKSHEGTLESQLKEYEAMLQTLKQKHDVELNGAISGYQSEIRSLREEIRVNNAILERE